MTDSKPVLKKLGMVGCGSMGGNMSLLFAEYGTVVHLYDPDEEKIKHLVESSKKANLDGKLVGHKDYQDFCNALQSPDAPKHFVFSIPHGDVADKSIDGLEPYLQKGDIIMDASNEHWQRTERRQKRLEPQGIHYVGMGVSGGYQSARHGPSISPGGSAEALKQIMPFLEQVAAKDKHGKACTVPVGPHGSGQYVKMVHNGIEQGMMSVICEIWGIMTKGLGMKYEEIADVFESWSTDESSPLVNCFLVSIGVDINRIKDDKGEFVLATVRDKVVQDVDETEGTGVWTVEESANLHVSAPTIAAAHLFRLASADAAARESASKASDGGVSPSTMDLGTSKQEGIKLLRDATYSAFLAAYVQGLHIIQVASEKYGWKLDYENMLQLWKGGCIIQSDFIVDFLQQVYGRKEFENNNLLTDAKIAAEFTKTLPGLKKVVVRSIEADQNVPALAASLEWHKYSTSTDLPTQFMEAELDYFGWHDYDLKSEPPGKPVTGKHHFEWKPAIGIHGSAP